MLNSKKNNNSIFLSSISKRKRAGFTLIELLVVIAIIGMLASVVMISLNSARSKARWAKMLTDFKQLNTAMELFYNKYGYYPCDVPPTKDPGTGPVQPLEEDITCVTHGLVESGFMSKILTSPCANWQYDWENWTNRVALPTGDSQAHIVRMTLRNVNASPTSKYYFCYKDTHFSTDSFCGGKIGDPAYTLGGIKVNDLVAQNAGGSLSCD